MGRQEGQLPFRRLFFSNCSQHRSGQAESSEGPAALVYLFDGEVVDEVVVVFVQVAVQGDAVALVEQVLQGVDTLDAQWALQAILQVGVVEDDVEAKDLSAHRHCLPGTACRETNAGKRFLLLIVFIFRYFVFNIDCFYSIFKSPWITQKSYVKKKLKIF